MRKSPSTQTRLDCPSILDVKLNLECRDEIVPILAGLQYVYSIPETRDSILDLVAGDVNRDSRDDCGRSGMDYWHMVVLASVRLGCNFNYDKLQDLAEQHRALRHIMGVGDWEEVAYSWRRIRDNLCLIQPDTIEKISHLIVAVGHSLDPAAVERVRADSFVVETNIHYPTESTLILDGTRKVIELCHELSLSLGREGWRQHAHLLRKIKSSVRIIAKIAASKVSKEERDKKLIPAYKTLLRRAERVLNRAADLCQQLETEGEMRMSDLLTLTHMRLFVGRTRHVCGTAYRRVILGEVVRNEEKLFSIFEPHTQLYKRGKAGTPVQFGRMVLIYEDSAGFVLHHHLMDRTAQDVDVPVEHTRILQERLDHQIKHLSFDSGFHSPENQEELSRLIDHPCIPVKGALQKQQQSAAASVSFHTARQRHPGVESAIGALQSGNGMKRCRDRSEIGFERYIALGILGRNLHTLGRLVIRRVDPLCEAARSYRMAA